MGPGQMVIMVPLRMTGWPWTCTVGPRISVPTEWSVTVSEDVHRSQLDTCSDEVCDGIHGWIYKECPPVSLRVRRTKVVMVTGTYDGSLGSRPGVDDDSRGHGVHSGSRKPDRTITVETRVVCGGPPGSRSGESIG